MKIRWEISDGYAGGSRPHYTEIDDEDLEGLSEKEKDEYIEDWVRGEFEQRVYYSWSIEA